MIDVLGTFVYTLIQLNFFNALTDLIFIEMYIAKFGDKWV